MTTDPRNPIDLVDDYVHGVLSPIDAERVERYCEENEDGRAALEAARARAEALGALPPIEASEALVRATMDRIEQHDTRRATYRRWFLGAIGAVTVASLLIVAGFHAYYAGLSPSPYDVRLIGQRDLLSGSRASVRLAVWDASADRPVAGVPVRLTLVGNGETIDLGEASTDERGIAQPVFDLPDWDDGSYQLQVIAATAGADEVLTESVELTRSWKLMVSTDKPVYKPGQTIQVRGLSLRRPDLQPVAGREATFTVTDPKGNIVFREKDVTGEYGIVATDCALATEIIEGPYTIDCEIGDTLSSVTVSVEKYVLPKFAIRLEPDAPFYAPGDRVRAKLNAGYFFGKPVAEASVSFVVETEAAGTKVIHEETALTDAAGDASVEFVLPKSLVGLERHAGDAAFRLVAIVTDTAGQKQATAVQRIVTDQPIHVDVVPEMGRLVKGVENKVYVFTSRADGRPARTRVRITGIEREIETSDLGVASFELLPEAEGDTRLTIVATSTDENGHTGREHVVLTPGDTPRDFVLRTDKAVYTGGESMTVTLLGGGVEPVFVDFIKDGQTVLTRTVDVEAGKGTAVLDLPAELFGTLRLCAYRFGKDGLAVQKLRTVHVNRADELTITTAVDRESYRPGEEAKLEFTLTDADGNPVPGALSLAAVDEAVFHVLKQRPGMEGTFFQLERDLLEPVYAIYGAWMPNMGAADIPVAERIEFEQALFARTNLRATEVRFGEGTDGGGDDGGIFGEGFGMEPGFDPAMVDDVMVDEPFIDVGVAPELGAGGGFDQDVTASPITLLSKTYEAKVERVAARRNAGLDAVHAAWKWVGVWGGVAALASVTVFFPLVGAGLTCLTLLVALIGPALAEHADAAKGEAEAVVMEGADMAWGGAGFGGGGMGAMDDMAMPMDAAIMEFAEPNAPDMMPTEDPGDPAAGDPAQPTRVRRYFPETLLWRPRLVTDENGRATLTVPLADSITTWRLTASAVSGDGRLGSLEDGVRVFQPFFVDLDLPVALVRNDEVAVPVVVYNYLDEPQTVELELANNEWFELLAEGADPAEATIQRIELGPGEVRSTFYRVRAKDVGTHRFRVTARANGVADALEREIAVDPDGRRVEQVVNGALDVPATVELTVPDDAIPGSVTAVVKMYPSGFSQLVEGLDGIFQQPYGCFEQTSSTTYPNILALQYLRESGQSVPEVEAKARQFIHLGYQRLLGFEVDGGGFEWFGNPPANVTLTAYGLLEFEDMAKVHDVDPQLIERTRNWLLRKRHPDGSWKAEVGMLNDGLAGAVQRGRDLDLATTAYVAWAVFGQGHQHEGGATLDYLLAQRPEDIDNPYTLAMVANALLALDPKGPAADGYLDRLLATRKTGGKDEAWWELGANEQTSFYGGGNSGNVEVTALTTLALLEAKRDPGTTKAALNWIVKQKQSNGTWPSTQATVLALQALVRGTSSPLGGEGERSFEIAIGDETVREWTVAADQAEVLQQTNVSGRIGLGTTTLRIAETTETGTGYQVAFRYHVPETEQPAEPEPLSVTLAFDRTDLEVHDSIVGTATVVNNTPLDAPMVIVDLPIPAGFRIDPVDLEELVASGDIAKYQVNARSAVVYLRELPPGRPLELVYRLEATMPVKLTVPPATVYEYYDPARRGRGKPLRLVVGEAT